MAQIHRVARREVCRLDKPPYPDGEDAATGAADLLRRGLTCRTIYDRSSLDHPGSLTVVEDLIRAGQQARVLAQVPVHLYLVDDRLAVVPVPAQPAGQGDAVIIVRPSALLDALIKLFDGLWQRALPLPSPTNPQPLEHRSFAATGQQRLITLLLSGLTDEAIARQLGLSHRTVQRRIAAMMADLGAHTRFQAGAQAAYADSAVGTDPGAARPPGTAPATPTTTTSATTSRPRRRRRARHRPVAGPRQAGRCPPRWTPRPRRWCDDVGDRRPNL
ncbi:LuxR C-terminal-related transcriptional regulator [Micromonospora rubida]